MARQAGTCTGRQGGIWSSSGRARSCGVRLSAVSVYSSGCLPAALSTSRNALSLATVTESHQRRKGLLLILPMLCAESGVVDGGIRHVAERLALQVDVASVHAGVLEACNTQLAITAMQHCMLGY